jgi:oligosaccharide repeat unit polymerase
MLTVIRETEVEAQAGADPFGFAANLTVLALLCAPAVFYESDGSWRWRLRSITAVVLVLAYGFLSGSKQNVLIVFVLFFVSWIRTGRLRLRILALSTAVVVTLFSIGIFFVNLASNAAAVGGAGSTVRRVANTVLAYWLGGVVAFSRVAEEPDSIKATQNIWRFFLELGRNLGFDVEVPALHLPYTIISGDPSIKFLGINVYTIYFSYFPDFGWAGVIIGMLFVGAITTAIWKRAARGSAPYSLIYASLCLGIVLSFFADYFWLNLNFYIKAGVFYATLYVLIPKLARTTKAIYS